MGMATALLELRMTIVAVGWGGEVLQMLWIDQQSC